MEDIARTQMGISQTIQSDVAAIKNTLIGGGVSAKQVTQTLVGAQKTADVLGGESTKKFGKTETVRGETEKALTDAGKLFKDLVDSDKSRTESLSQYLEKVGTQMKDMEVRFKEAMKEYGEQVSSKLSDRNPVEALAKRSVDKIRGESEKNTGNVQPINSGSRQIQETITKNNQTIINKGTVDVGGKIQVDVKVPVGVSESQVKQIIDSAFNDPKFKDYVVRLVTPNDLKKPEDKNF